MVNGNHLGARKAGQLGLEPLELGLGLGVDEALGIENDEVCAQSLEGVAETGLTHARSVGIREPVDRLEEIRERDLVIAAGDVDGEIIPW